MKAISGFGLIVATSVQSNAWVEPLQWEAQPQKGPNRRLGPFKNLGAGNGLFVPPLSP